MNPAERMTLIQQMATNENIHYTFARNMLCEPLTKEHPMPTEEEHAWMQNTVLRVAYAIQVGAVLELREVNQSSKKWWVILKHEDGTSDAIKPFRRRKRAESWIANIYLFALDKPGIRK